MTFTKNTPKPENSGRAKGTVNKNTEMLRVASKSAVDIVRESGVHPVAILTEAGRFLRNVSVALAPQGKNADELTEAVRKMASTPDGMRQLEAMRKFWETASSIAYKAAEFGCPKLARVDYVGDAPSGPRVENKMLFTLNIDGGEAPGRPVQTDMARLDAHVVQPEEYEDAPELTDEQLAKADLYEGSKLLRRGKPEPVDVDEWAMDED